MPKRLTDNTKWRDPWFADLEPRQKLFYLYLLDACDHAGVWKCNFRLASFEIGQQYEESECLGFLSGRVEVLPNGYWYLTKFISYQYGGVNNDAVGRSVQKVLNQFNIEIKVAPTKGLSSPYLGAKVKDKDKDKEKAKPAKKSRLDIELDKL